MLNEKIKQLHGFLFTHLFLHNLNGSKFQEILIIAGQQFMDCYRTLVYSSCLKQVLSFSRTYNLQKNDSYIHSHIQFLY